MYLTKLKIIYILKKDFLAVSQNEVFDEQLVLMTGEVGEMREHFYRSSTLPRATVSARIDRIIAKGGS